MVDDMVFSSSENDLCSSSDDEAKNTVLSDVLSEENSSRPNTLPFPSKPIQMKTQGLKDKTLLRVIKTSHVTNVEIDGQTSMSPMIQTPSSSKLGLSGARKQNSAHVTETNRSS